MSSPWPAAAAVLAPPAAGLWTAAAWQKSALRAARRMSSGGDVRVAIFVGWLAEWLDAMVPGVFIVVWPLGKGNNGSGGYCLRSIYLYSRRQLAVI